MLINLLSSQKLERKKWVEKLAAGGPARGSRVENQIFQQAKQEKIVASWKKRSVEFYCWVHVTHMLLEMGESSIQF